MADSSQTPGRGGTVKKKKGADSRIDDALHIGDEVEIHGLQGAKELNGRRGRLVSWVEETQRFGVRLEGELESKAVKPMNLRKVDQDGDAEERAALEAQLAQVVQHLKTAEEGSQARSLYQRKLADLIKKLKDIDEANEAKAKQRAAAAASAARAASAAAAATTAQKAPEKVPEKAPEKAQVVAPKPPATTREPVSQGLMPPPLPRDQHNPLPKREKKEPIAREPKAEPRPPPAPKPMPPPILPERPAAQALQPERKPPVFTDEQENPDPNRAFQAGRVAAGALLCGVMASQADLFPATWFVWTFLGVHVVGVVCLTEYADERGLLVLCATFGLHAGVALSEVVLWTFGRDGEDSVGPWSVLVLSACILYLHAFSMEASTLPPDYITSISLFFPMFPAYNAAVAFSCLELFLEWRWFPEYKLWSPLVALGAAMCAAGQVLIARACRTADRNYWASCRNMPEDDPKPEDFVGLEIPDRRIVQEGVYRWERHPAYLGAMLWGLGIEVALCNPVMLVIVGFVLWASLLYVTLEEEQELYDEFKGGYANYASLTCCWIPLFDGFLENNAFQREMTDICEEEMDGLQEDMEEEPEEEAEEDDCNSEDELLWDGVPKGGALWNRQFLEPLMLG
eukprot:TRINITY_DN92528_c0_g1_i1.p1 TRINITY_DN92528_c0_g1~~TRINITY_DN92528_c0_g1_i1.p1  ORF type:complete len:634 (-),score=149.03 TRINITY_DN92528_c0_g1_i1:151-2031(-)